MIVTVGSTICVGVNVAVSVGNGIKGETTRSVGVVGIGCAVHAVKTNRNARGQSLIFIGDIISADMDQSNLQPRWV